MNIFINVSLTADTGVLEKLLEEPPLLALSAHPGVTSSTAIF